MAAMGSLLSMLVMMLVMMRVTRMKMTGDMVSWR